MASLGKTYIPIDKRILTENAEVNFAVYQTNETKTQMSVMLQSDSVIKSKKYQIFFVSFSSKKCSLTPFEAAKREVIAI